MGKVVSVDNGNKWYITKFIEFQYGDLNPNNKVHKSVLDILQKDGIKPLASPLRGAMDKDKAKDKVKDKEAQSIIQHFNTTTQSNLSLNTEGNLKFIRARLTENYTLEDCKKVIDKKHAEWKDDPNMSKYIRISTLFNSEKFDTYLNQKGLNENVPESLRKYIK